ncbi:YrhC family protein [Bacillus aquiflavi]|nr:YrhC family protein [Bacillus aquiflavi]UAC47333.1 YrhC family protein [Bacillus aquiflavi]
MKQNVKEIYEKMIDYKQYAVVLLAFGAFLYLGLIIPSVEKSVK